MTRALRLCTSAAFVTACALAAPSAGAQWTDATSTVPHNAGITFAPAGARAVRVSWKPWNVTTSGLKYHLLRAADSTSAGSDISGAIAALTFTDAAVPPGTTFFYWVTVDPPQLPGGRPGPAGMQVVSGRVRFTLVMQAVALPNEAGAGRVVQAAAPTPQLPAHQPLAQQPLAQQPPAQQPPAQQPPPPALPTISRLMSNVVPIGAPTFVVRGSHLNLVTKVKVGGVVQAWQKEACSGFDGADTSYVVTLAAPVPGATTVELTSPAGTISAPLTVEAAAISYVRPDAAKPGDWVTIMGTQLADFQYSYTAGTCKTVTMSATGPTSVRFGSVAATAVRGVAGAGVLTAQVPARGAGPIAVATAVHGTAISSVRFVEVPTITSMAPTTVNPGDIVTITGTALDGVRAVEMAPQLSNAQQGQKVLVSGPIITYDSVRFRMPPNAYGRTIPVLVYIVYTGVPGGRASFGTVSNQLTFVMPVVVTGVTPNPAAHGVAVTITGTGFADLPAGAPAGWVPVVTFNGTPATGVRIGNATTIYATVPAGATTGPVKVGAVVGPVVTISP
jgi:hypothetical protein